MIAFLISTCAFAQQDTLPQILPKNFNSTEGKRALRNWLKGWTMTNNMAIDEATYKGKQWMQVYYRMDFVFMYNLDPDEFMGEINLKALNESINQATALYDATGSKIQVHFVSDISIYRKDEVSESTDYRTNGSFLVQPKNKSKIKPVTIYIYDPMDSFWSDNKHLESDGTGRSFSKPTEGKIFLSMNQLWALPHELIHGLLGHEDAYYEPGHNDTTLEDENMLCDLGSQSCDPKQLDPIEIYTSLKLRGYEAPGWDLYAKKTLKGRG